MDGWQLKSITIPGDAKQAFTLTMFKAENSVLGSKYYS